MNATAFNNFRQVLSLPPNCLQSIVRQASKKASANAKNQRGSGIASHYGWKKNEGCYVQESTILVRQTTLRFLPGLNVGFGKNGTLFAIIPGRVVVTCEKVDLNWDHTWVMRCYGDRCGKSSFYKKYFNVIPEPQHQNFKLIDQI